MIVFLLGAKLEVIHQVAEEGEGHAGIFVFTDHIVQILVSVKLGPPATNIVYMAGSTRGYVVLVQAGLVVEGVLSQNTNIHSNHLFKKGGRYFAFSVNTLVTFEVSKVCYELLRSNPINNDRRFLRSHDGKYKKADVEQATKEIAEWGLIGDHTNSDQAKPMHKQANLFSPNDEGRLEINGAYLALTNKCNLRCKYCSAGYGQYGSGDSKSQMTREIAKKSVDFVVSHLNKNCDQPNIIFAGGEPLLNFDTLKYVVEYFETKPRYKPQYLFNTNGTLMSEEMARWLVEKNIPFRFSIDGTREIHNSNRVFANGRGSYDRVMQGVQNYLRFGKNGFLVQTSIPKAKELVHCIHALWDIGANHVVANLTAESVFVDNRHQRPQKSDWQRYIKEYQTLSAEICNNLIYFGHSKLISNVLDFIKRLYRRQQSSGTCGVCKTISIDVFGRFYPCQGLVGFQEHLIGSLKEDFQLDKISRFEQVYSRYTLRCANCWARNICSGGCYALSYQYREMDSNFEPTRWCNFNRKIIENSIFLYNEIKERKPHLLESLFPES